MIAASLMGAGCSSGGSSKASADASVEPPSPAAQANPAAAERMRDLRARFGAKVFAADRAPSPAIPRATATLPATADRATEVRDDRSGLAARFSLIDAAPSPHAAADGLVLYAGALAGADVIRRVQDDGIEDFVAFEAEPAHERVAYDLDVSRVAGLRLVANTLELLDAAGTPRLRVAPPYLIDAQRTRAPAQLAVEGCAFDTNPAGPWGRAIVPPGATHCRVVVSWRGVAYPALLDPGWTTTGNLALPRSGHLAPLLKSGKVLAFGGGWAESELYDPATGTWSASGTSSAASAFAATILTDGRVLVDGGSDLNGTTAYATGSIYDPGTGSFVAAANLAEPRAQHTSTLLPSGKVLVAGGFGTPPFAGQPRPTLSTAEIFDPATGSWAPAASMLAAHAAHTATLLTNGKVLVAGGGTAELYDPTTNVWTKAGTPTATRYDALAAALPDGKAIVIAGSDTAGAIVTSKTAEIFDAKTGTWSATADMAKPRAMFAGSIVAGGKVVVAGGQSSSGDTSSVEMFDPALGRWLALPDMIVPRQRHALTTLANGKVLLSAGQHYDAYLLPAVDGTTCASTADCVSGFCVDGVCCDTTCTERCGACNLPGKIGTCSAVAGQPLGARLPCGATACDLACDGVDKAACHYPTSACSGYACTGGVESHPSTCNGAGACSDVPKSCAPYVCGATGCKSSCTAAADCVAGFECRGNVCLPPLATAPLGATCMDASNCANGASCTDGVCCASVGCTGGSACNVNGKGTCAKLNGVACAIGAECGSGFCADGVCCDKACDGQCEACDIPGKPGQCAPVVGQAPHGQRAACDAGGGNVCAARVCDGNKDVTTCQGYAMVATACAPAACKDDVLTPASSCDGKGACATPATRACAPYACADATSCATTCKTIADCAHGYFCADGTCSAITATCSADGTQSVPLDGSGPNACAPYRCDTSTGNCFTQCATTDQCAASAACASAVCTQTNTPPADTGSGGSGGCAIDAGGAGAGSSTLGALAAFGALAWVVSARRRRR